MPPSESPPPLRAPTENEKAALRSVLGVRVAAARKRLNLSQRAMAKLCEMSGSWAREVESGSQFAPAWLIAMLAEATGWQVGWFYGFGFKRGGGDRCAACRQPVAVPWRPAPEDNAPLGRWLVCSAECNTAMEEDHDG